MARAHNVYIVMGSAAPMAAFTVKHELKSWLKSRKRLPATMVVYRLRDGKGDMDYDIMNYRKLLWEDE